MKLFLIQLVCFVTSLGANAQVLLTDDVVLKYFNEVAYGSEFHTGDSSVIRKWQSDINIYVKGNPTQNLLIELDAIISELNELISGVTLSKVTRQKDSNMVIVFGSAADYIRIEPSAKQHIKNNYGMFWLHWNEQNVIEQGSVYVDTKRAKTPRWQKHLLREELTQALGLMRDSFSYPDSIFYQKYSIVNSYSALDKAVIILLYNSQITPNMPRKTATKILKKLLSADDAD